MRSEEVDGCGVMCVGWFGFMLRLAFALLCGCAMKSDHLGRKVLDFWEMVISRPRDKPSRKRG